MKRIALLALSLMVSSLALAEGTESEKTAQPKSGDIVVNFNIPGTETLTNILPISQIGQAAYSVQEATVAPALKSVGIQNFYVWVGVNNQYIPIDPMRFTQTK